MQSLETRTLEVIDRCYAGVLDDAAWEQALVAVADLVGGTGTLLFAMQPATKTIMRFDVARFDPEIVVTYGAHWTSRDIRAAPALLAPVGVPQTEETLLSARSLRRSAIYNEFLQRVDAPHFINTWLHRSPDRVVSLAIQGSRRRGAFETSECERLAAVLPHVTRAIELKDRLGVNVGVSGSLFAVADALPVGILVVDAHGLVLEASQAARRILAAADGLYTLAGRIAFRRRADEQAFARLLTTSMVGRTGPPTLRVSRQHKAPLSLIIAPVRSDTEPWMTAVQQWIVAIQEPAQFSTPTPGDVSREWHVTAAEARVVCLLASGSTIQEIAGTLRVSIHTVRSQLKAVYAKTGLTSQLEVVRRLLAGAADTAAG
jgi:DNA-binding CsgD family transcriptional regulator